MAIIPESQYPGKITPASTEYPYGEARNITLPGDGTGTPWEAALVNDIFGFQQALLSEADITPSGDPETATESQYKQALDTLYGNRVVRSATVAGLSVFSPESGWQALVAGVPFKYTGAEWIPSAGFVLVECYGASPESADNTAAYDLLIAAVPEHTAVLWGRPGETYIGNFWSQDKSLRCNLNGAILEDFTNDPICAIGSLTDITEYDVTEAELNYGDTSFTITGADGLFSVGDIGYLWDQAVRPTGGDVNFETVKIKALSGDVVTVEGFLASYKGAAAIKFYHRSTQIKNAEIRNGTITPSDTHTFIVSGFFNVDGTRSDSLRTENTAGNALTHRFCYNVTTRDIEPENPRDVGSGNGYGVQLRACSRFHVSNIRGLRCRHALDGDSLFFGEVWDISDPEATSAPVDIAHNGFIGHVSIDGVDVVTDSYPVNMSDNGYGGSPSADRDKHPLRGVTVKRVRCTVPTALVNGDNVTGVYAQNNVENFHVDDIEVRYVDGTAVSPTAGSHIVRVNGVVTGGACSVKNISANKTGVAVTFFDQQEGVYNGAIADIENIHLDECRHHIRSQGRMALAYDKLTSQAAPVGGSAVFLQDVGADSPAGCYGGTSIALGEDDAVVLDYEDGTCKGSLPLSGRQSAQPVNVDNGSLITRGEVQNHSNFMRLVPPVGASITLDATAALPAPSVQGEEIYIAQPASGRGEVVFPAGDNIIGGFTIAEEGAVRLIADTGKWRLAGKWSLV